MHENQKSGPGISEQAGNDTWFLLSNGGSREALQVLMDTMPDIVTFKDGCGRWLEVNQAAAEFFRLEGIDFNGKTNTELAGLVPSHSEVFSACEECDANAWENGKSYQHKKTGADAGSERENHGVYHIPPV